MRVELQSLVTRGLAPQLVKEEQAETVLAVFAPEGPHLEGRPLPFLPQGRCPAVTSEVRGVRAARLPETWRTWSALIWSTGQRN